MRFRWIGLETTRRVTCGCCTNQLMVLHEVWGTTEIWRCPTCFATRSTEVARG
jgi:hypothetical protein